MLVHTVPKSYQVGRLNMVTLMREVPADLETPVSVYLKLSGNGPSFLLESVTGGEQVARYSFIGASLNQAYMIRRGRLERHVGGRIERIDTGPGNDPLDALRMEIGRFHPDPIPGLPRFSGGLVGYLGYEIAAAFEPSIPVLPDISEDSPPEAIFLLADTLVAFDHAYGRLLLIANHPYDPDDPHTELAALDEAGSRLEALLKMLSTPLPQARPVSSSPIANVLNPEMSHEEFIAAVSQAKSYIAAGDIFQVVLSQRFSRETPALPFEIYRSLRRINPSPYMFYLEFAGLAGSQPLRLIGASPEMHVRLEGERRAAIRPIAGTRPRGSSPAEDQAFEQDLLADPKECAEHIMLVDLARNDLGRVCEYGSVVVPELMAVERYSHVMHIVSQVEGRLRPEFDRFDLMRVTFPAGTVSGAPKIRAMQIIASLEKRRRGPYAGAVGYFSYAGSMDTCIAIRTLVMHGQTVHLQAGAGIVADSDPEREYQETLNKARALELAIDMAEREYSNVQVDV